MTNSPRNRQSARAAQAQRPKGELKYSLMIAPPDGPRDEEGVPVPQQIDIDLRHFTLAERQMVKRVLAKFVQPPDWEDVLVAHSWVVWRRSNPTSSLQAWMDDIEWGDLLDALQLEPGHVHWDTTPEGFDPEA